MRYVSSTTRPGVIRRIIKLGKTPDGRFAPVEVYENDNRPTRKRIAKQYRPFGRMLRKLARGQARAAVVYLERHDQSNQRKRNGFAKDLRRNMRAAWRAAKKEID